jgi:hypothetical protein
MVDRLSVRREKGNIWSYIRKKWLEETPEETVRQEYLCTLANEYGFSTDRMDEELEVTGCGSGYAGTDFIIWRRARDKSDSRTLIIVECKSDNVTIRPDDYYPQGARLTNARFFVMGLNRAQFGQFEAARDKLVVRDVAQRGQSENRRNLIINALQTVGAVAGGASTAVTQGLSDTSEATDMASAVAIFQGPFITGVTNIFGPHD